jgi:hypothetical protein
VYDPLEVDVRRLTKYLAPGAWTIVAAFLVAVPAHAAGLTDTTGQPPASRITTLSPAALASLQTAAAEQTQPGTPTPEGGAFFKTKKGAAVIVLIGAGFGYALYSQRHDRVLSQIR